MLLNNDDLRLSCRSKALNNFQIVMCKPEIEISTTVRINENICDFYGWQTTGTTLANGRNATFQLEVSESKISPCPCLPSSQIPKD